MLIAHAKTHDNEKLLILGLSAENRARLRSGRPIDLRLNTDAGPMTIVIFAGETEDEMQGELFGLTHRQTKIDKVVVV